MKRFALVLVAMLGMAACGQSAEQGAENEVAADTLTRAQKDSVLATLPIPGAGKIGEARQAVDKINARVARHDSMSAGN